MELQFGQIDRAFAAAPYAGPNTGCPGLHGQHPSQFLPIRRKVSRSKFQRRPNRDFLSAGVVAHQFRQRLRIQVHANVDIDRERVARFTGKRLLRLDGELICRFGRYLPGIWTVWVNPHLFPKRCLPAFVGRTSDLRRPKRRRENPPADANRKSPTLETMRSAKTVAARHVTLPSGSSSTIRRSTVKLFISYLKTSFALSKHPSC